MSNIDDLFFSLKLDSSSFDTAIKKAETALNNIGDKTVKLNFEMNDTVLRKLQDLRNISNISVSVSGIPQDAKIAISADEANLQTMRDKVAGALQGINITDLTISTEKLQEKLLGMKISFTVDKSMVNAAIKEMQQLVKAEKLTISVAPSLSDNAIGNIKTKVERELKNLNISGINLTINRRDIQEELSKRPFTAQLNLRINKQDVADAVRMSVDAASNNQQRTSERLSQAREKAQKRVTKAATDELGIRKSINDQMRTNTMLATIFGNAIGNVFSTIALQRFLEALIEVGGEIQKQRLALGHLLQSDTYGNTIFEQMKSLAVKSPYGLLDLMQNARQLTAFGVQYNELFDTMKRLSDVASGLGIQFGRISLAYGETMERGFLDGKLVRQFSYMGLPILQKVAEYYEKINKFGNNMPVSPMQVRELVSERGVSFEDVRAVIKELTDEGGQFFNMQEVMADSVAGKWKNLHDAIDIMYNRLAEGNSAVLKYPAELLTSLTRNWEKLIPVLSIVAIRLGGVTLANKIFAAAAGKTAAAEWEEALATQRLEQAELNRRRNLGIELTVEQKKLLNSRMLTAEYAKLALANDKLSIAEKRLLATRLSVNRENAYLMGQYGAINSHTAALIVRGNLLQRTFGKIGAHAQLLGLRLAFLSRQMWYMTKAFLANPTTWIMAAIGAAIAFLQKTNEIKTALENVSKGVNDVFDNLQEQSKRLGNIKIEFTVENDAGKKIGEAASDMQQYVRDSLAHDDVSLIPIDEAAAKQRMDDLVEYIKNNAPNANSLINEVFKLDDNGRFVYDMGQRIMLLENYREVLQDIADNNTAAEVARNIGSSMIAPNAFVGMFEDNILEDTEQYIKAQQEAKREIYNYLVELESENRDIVSRYKKQYNAASIAELANKMMTAVLDGASFGFVDSAARKVHSAKQEFYDEVNELYKTVQIEARKLGIFDLTNLTDKQKTQISLIIKTAIESNEGSEDAKKLLLNEFSTRCNLELGVEPTDASAKDVWDAVLGHKGKYETKEGTLKARVDEAGKNYKQATEDIEAYTKKYKNYMNYFRKTESGYEIIGNIPSDRIEQVKQAREELNSFFYAQQNALKTLNEAGVDPASFLKGKKGSSTDTLLERWRTQFDELQKAYAAFKKWSASIGKDQAAQKIKELGIVNEEMLKDTFSIKTADLADPKTYSAAVKKFYDNIERLLTTEQRKKFGNSVRVKWSDIEFDINQDIIKRAAEKVVRDINNTMRQLDVWSAWFDVTGSNATADKMAASMRPIWDKTALELRKILENEISGKMSLTDSDFGADVSEIAMKERMQLVGVSEEVFNLWKRINDTIINAGATFSRDMAKVVGGTATYEEKINAVFAKYDEQRKKNRDQNGNILNGDIEYGITNAQNEEVAKLRLEQFKRESGWEKVFGNLDKMSTQTMNRLREQIRQYMKDWKLMPEQVKAVEEALDKLDAAQAKKSPIASMVQALNQIRNARRMRNSMSNGEIRVELNAKGDIINRKTKEDTEQELGEGIELLNASIKALTSKLSALSNAFGMFGEMFDAAGLEGIGDTLNNTAELLSSGANGANQGADIADALGFSTQWGAAIGAGVSLMTTVFAMHDKALQKEIEASQQRVREFESASKQLAKNLERAFGGIYTVGIDNSMQKKLDDIINDAARAERLAEKVKLDTETSMKRQGATDAEIKTRVSRISAEMYRKYSDETLKAAQTAKESNSYFQAQYVSLLAQREELQSQMQAEEGKKKTDSGKIQDYNDKIAEMDDEIKNFARDMANELWSIDFQDWANQLSDSLVNAWRNGEDAVKAYKDTVSNMLANLMTSVIQKNYMEKILSPLADEFFEQFKDDGGKITEQSQSILARMTQYIGASVDATNAALSATEEYLNRNGNTLKTTAASNVGNSISSMTEETADLLGSYMNSIRVDVTAQRTILENLQALAIDPNFGMEANNAIARMQLQQLNAIAENTLRHAEAADEIRRMLMSVIEDETIKVS